MANRGNQTASSIAEGLTRGERLALVEAAEDVLDCWGRTPSRPGLPAAIRALRVALYGDQRCVDPAHPECGRGDLGEGS